MLDAEVLVKLAAKSAAEKKAQDILILDVANLLVITNYFLICSGKTNRQVKTISQFIQEKLGEKKTKPIGREGEDKGIWILLDYGDVVIHVFTEQERNYYELERLWRDAPQFEWEEG